MADSDLTTNETNREREKLDSCTIITDLYMIRATAIFVAMALDQHVNQRVGINSVDDDQALNGAAETLKCAICERLADLAERVELADLVNERDAQQAPA